MHTDDVFDGIIPGACDQANKIDKCPTTQGKLHVHVGASPVDEATHEVACVEMTPASLSANTGMEGSLALETPCACKPAQRVGGAAEEDVWTQPGPPNVTTPPKTLPAPSKQIKVPLATFSRRITSEMSLRLVNIPKAMHKGLGLTRAYPVAGRRRSKRGTIYVRMPGGWTHPVTMMAASGSYHRRLTDGWAVVCRVAKIRIGDTVRFSRTERCDTLDLAITRAGG